MIVRKLLPIKAHFFFFMAALGPILPQLQVFGKQLGISSVIMGTVTGILPFAYLLAKPVVGIIVDVYRDYRKTIFMGLILAMAVAYGCIIFIPMRTLKKYDFIVNTLVKKCNNTVNATDFNELQCSSDCFIKPDSFHLYSASNSPQNASICAIGGDKNLAESPCRFKCEETSELPDGTLLTSPSFWCFVALLSIGTIAFNVVNSLTDAICFDVIGDKYDYGKQRTWGAVGYGITALVSGYAMDNLTIFGMSGYKPAICIMLIFALLDLVSCIKLKLPIIPAPTNIWKELQNLMKYKTVCVFLVFTVIAGTADGFMTYFLLWFVEDLTEVTERRNLKLLEGCIIASETFGGEILCFYVGDNILKKFGHINCFSLCFMCYGLRLFLISIVTSPWTIVFIEFFLQGPTYALTYLTIVAYANDIAPSGTSATMQGIAAGLDDGLGYALGSLSGGILYRYIGARETFQIFCAMSVVSGIAHYLIHRCCLTPELMMKSDEEAKYVNVPQSCNT